MIKQKVQETARKTATIESDFVQEKEMSVLSEKIISKGKFYFKKEKRLRWEYTAPFPYMIIINNDQMYVKDDNTENRVNMQTNKVFRDINNIILGAVQGTLLSDQKNFQSAFSDSRTYYVVKIVPQSAKIKESLNEIILYFNKNDYSVERLLMREASGDYTRIDFKEKKSINRSAMKSSLFLSLVLLLALWGCSPIDKSTLINTGKGTVPQKAWESPFMGMFEKSLFRTTMDIREFHLTGYTIIKKSGDTSYRIVFANDIGMTIFDVEFLHKKFISHYIFAPCRKRHC